MTKPTKPTAVAGPTLADAANPQVFSTKTFDWVEYTPLAVQYIADSNDFVEAQADAAANNATASADSATASAASATASANSATASANSATESEGFKDSAQTAAAAAQAAAGLPSLVGNSGKVLSVNPAEDGVLWTVLNTQTTVETFTTSGTFTKEADDVAYLVECIGAGQGGQGGRGRDGSASSADGGDGGLPGTQVYAFFDEADVPASVAVAIGAGSLGTQEPPTDNISGPTPSLAAPGGTTTFGSLLSAEGGGVVASASVPLSSTNAHAAVGTATTGIGNDGKFQRVNLGRILGSGAAGGSPNETASRAGGTGGGTGPGSGGDGGTGILGASPVVGMPGSNGVAPGGGGGGGGGATDPAGGGSAQGGKGGDGARGEVRIWRFKK